MKKAAVNGATSEERRRMRLAEALRNNLALRKARSKGGKSAEPAAAEQTEQTVISCAEGASGSDKR